MTGGGAAIARPCVREIGDSEMQTTERALVLFDIDGTLIQTLGAGIRSMNAAFARLYQAHGALDEVAVAGRTDRAILRDAFVGLGIDPTVEALRGLREAYFDELALELQRPAAVGRFGVLPGVPEILDALEADRSVSTALLTGNFAAGAAIKLGHFDLWRRFGFGAFGDDHLDRRDLVPVALARAAAAGITPSSVVVVGDTPLDVDCAHAHGATAVAVATGPYSTDQLAAAGADLVVETLESLAGTDLVLARARTERAEPEQTHPGSKESGGNATRK